MKNLEQCRAEIDVIDKEMAKLFEQRMSVCQDIAAYKKERGLPVVDGNRENAIVASRAALIDDPVKREYYTLFIRNTMKLSCQYQSRLNSGIKVAYSGTEGAFGHIAAQKLFPNGALTSFTDFAGAYHAVENGELDCAVLPIENSHAGDVGVVMDLIFSGSLYVNQIIELDVVHHLMGVEGATPETVKTVISHPQAIDQCHDFIEKHGYTTMDYSNTALAAKYVKEAGDPTIAAIASQETADVFGLKVLAQGINSARDNTTRFAVFSRSQNIPAPSPDKCHFILVFTTKNEAGALAQALNIIGAHNYNMRTLQSRPMKGLMWNYYFFLELEGDIGTENGRNMMHELSAVCARLKLVGAYV